MKNNIYSRRVSCRLCNDSNLSLVLPIKPSPIADAFIEGHKKNEIQPLIPLDLYQCELCGHLQNLDIVNPELLFRNYLFNTGDSAGLVKHFREYAADNVQRFTIEKNSLVVEIGSNDGTLLGFFKEFGPRVLGVDPAIGIAKEANNLGIPTLCEFFSSSLAEEIRTKHGKAKLIVANNVYAHSDNLSDITRGIALLLEDNGVFIFEVSYLLDIIDKFLFDTVYHEHLSYHSFAPLVKFFESLGLHLFDVRRIGTKGGSVRGFVQKIGGPQKEMPVIKDLLNQEEYRELHKPGIFREYERQIMIRKQALHDFIKGAINQGNRVVGYGASTTVTTLMYHFELQDKLEYLIDDNDKKHGLYSPGIHLEVKPSDVLYTDKPDVVIVLAWQYADPIIKKHANYISAGGKFVVPLPELKIVSHPMEVMV